MSLPLTQHVSSPARTDATLTGTHTVDMTGWALQAKLKDSTGATINTKTTGSGITISTVTADVDYTDGTSYALTVGFYHVYIRRTDTAERDLLAVIQWEVRDRDP